MEGGGSEAADCHCEMLEMTDGCGEGGGSTWMPFLGRQVGAWVGGEVAFVEEGGERLVERVGCDWVV